MKIGNIEGTPEEIKGLFDNNGLNLAHYINANQPIHNAATHNYMTIGAILVFVVVNCILWTADCSEVISKILIIFNFAVLAVLVFFIHQRYDKIVLSIFSLFIGVLIMGISLGYLTPKEAWKKVNVDNPISKTNKE